MTCQLILGDLGLVCDFPLSCVLRVIHIFLPLPFFCCSFSCFFSSLPMCFSFFPDLFVAYPLFLSFT